MLERFRGAWAAFMTPPAKLFIALKVHPDVISWVGMVLTAGTALYFLPRGWLWQGALLLIVFILSDGIDGQMARMTDSSSSYGAFLDSSLDRIGDGAIFGGVVLYYAGPGNSVWWAAVCLVALVLGQVTSYVKARGESLGFEVKGGIAARADRLVVLWLGILVTGLGVWWALPLGLSWLALASAITVGQRMRQVRSQAQARDAERSTQ